MSKARQLADNGASTPNRNVIINGAMNVAQRSTSETGVGASGGYFTLDRFYTDFANTAGRVTLTQTADGPSGFGKCMKFACTTADTSIASGEAATIQQRIEGHNLQRFKKGTADAEKFAVSFYVKGNASATYTCELITTDTARSFSKTFSVTTSWTRVELLFDADTTGAIADDNTVGLYLIIWLHAGSDYTSGTATTGWTGYTSNTVRVHDQTSFFDSTDRTFFLTGVQMEVGNFTPFEHKTYAQDLIECQHYYFKFLEGNNKEIGVAWYYSSSHASFMFRYPTTMRATPTATDETGTGYYTLYAAGGSDAFNSVTFENGSTESYSALNNSEVSGTAGQAGIVRGTNASAKIEFDAEL